jgi:vacuolar-type H+-ATPase subunit I/STV1
MTRIRRVDSYRNPYLAINQLRKKIAYGSNPVDGVKAVEPAAAFYNDLTEPEEDYEHLHNSNSGGGEKQTLKQTISQYELSQSGFTPPKRGLETVTLQLERYDQMRKDQEKLQQLEKELAQMIHFSLVTSTVHESKAVKIRIDKERVKQYVTERIHNSSKLPKEVGIDGSDIDFF